MLTYDEMKLVAEGCYRPSNDQRVRAMVKLIEDIVFPEHVFSYSEEEMLNALMRKIWVFNNRAAQLPRADGTTEWRAH